MLIRSTSHPAVRRIVELQLHRYERDRNALFYAEGVRFLAQAYENGAPIEEVVIAPELFVSRTGRDIVRLLGFNGTRCLQVTPDVFRSISRSAAPQGVGIVVRQQIDGLESISPSEGLCWLAHDAIRSAGNLGTILRTSEAVGGAGVILLGREVDPYDPVAVRASMGAIFRQRIVRTAPRRFAAWKRQHGLTVIGASPHARQDYRTLSYTGPVALFLGSERKGLSEQMEGLCDALVRIPMSGYADSLNVAIAAGVLLYEVYAQKRADSVEPARE